MTDSAGISHGVVLKCVMAGGQPRHSRQHCAAQLRQRRAVLVPNRSQMAVHYPRRQFPHAQVAECRDYLTVEPISIRAQRAGGAVLGGDFGEPGLRQPSDLGVRCDLRSCSDVHLIAQSHSQSPFGCAFRSPMPFDTARDAVVVAVQSARPVAGTVRSSADAAVGTDRKRRASHRLRVREPPFYPPETTRIDDR